MSENVRIPTNLRALRIIEIVGRCGKPMTPTEINRHVGLPKQTIHRLCATLREEGYLDRDIDRKRLRPGRRLRVASTGLIHASYKHIFRHQVLSKVSAEVQETVNFVVPRESGMRYLDRVETDWPMRIQLPVGTDVPFHCTASGKVFLAHLPRAERKAFVEGMLLTRLTSNTLWTPKSLLENINKVVNRGYALDREEFIEGMNAVAVPVTDGKGRYVASLAIHGPTARFSIRVAVSRTDALLAGATALKKALFS